MIVRAFHATATAEGADTYYQHFTRSVLPDLQRIDGYHGACLLRRDRDHHVELQVLTLWESLEAVSRFAEPGPVPTDPESGRLSGHGHHRRTGRRDREQ